MICVLCPIPVCLMYWKIKHYLLSIKLEAVAKTQPCRAKVTPVLFWVYGILLLLLYIQVWVSTRTPTFSSFQPPPPGRKHGCLYFSSSWGLRLERKQRFGDQTKKGHYMNEVFCSSWAEKTLWRLYHLFWIISGILLDTLACYMLLRKRSCKYLSCMCNKCTMKSWLIWRKYAWMTWSATTCFSGSHASKISVFYLYFDSACDFALYVFAYWIKQSYASMWKTLKAQRQWYARQTPCSGIWTLPVLIGMLGEHGQFPSFRPASFNTAHFLSWVLFIWAMAILAVSMSWSVLPMSL